MGKFQPGHKLSVGNKGGGRLGYTFERDQLVRLRKMVDRAIWMGEAIQKGKASDRTFKAYKTLELTILKAMDKLHANKAHLDVDLNIKPIPLLHVLHNNGNPKDLPAEEAYPSLPGRDISG